MRQRGPALAHEMPQSAGQVYEKHLMTLAARRYIKCIITRDSTLILDPDQAAVKIFVQQLQQKLRDSCAASEKPPSANGLALTLQAVNDLPYELRVLETALDNVRPSVHFLASKTGRAHPVLLLSTREALFPSALPKLMPLSNGLCDCKCFPGREEA